MKVTLLARFASTSVPSREAGWPSFAPCSPALTWDRKPAHLGEKLASFSLDYPFGENWYYTDPANKMKFTSYERDEESGLDYAMFRYHNSRLGRFMSPDPIHGRRCLHPQEWKLVEVARVVIGVAILLVAASMILSLRSFRLGHLLVFGLPVVAALLIRYAHSYRLRRNAANR